MARVLSVEDKDLSKKSLITSRKKIHSDIDLTFAKRPSGDIYKKTEAAAVKQAVQNLVLTNRFERPFQPDLGGNLQGMFFELMDRRTAREARENIKNVLYVYEPRAEVLGIDVYQNDRTNSINVTITFKVVNTDEVLSVNTVVSRLR